LTITKNTEQTELDSNADTSVAGANFRILFETEEYATVHTLSSEKQPFDKKPIGTAATAWTDPKGQTYILRLNQALLFGDRLDHSLLRSMMFQFNLIETQRTLFCYDQSLLLIRGLPFHS
jgi:hypothetical protein